MCVHRVATDMDLNVMKMSSTEGPSPSSTKWAMETTGYRNVKIKDAKNLSDKMMKTYLNTFLNILVKILNTTINCLTLITEPWTPQEFSIQKVYVTDHYQILGFDVWLKKPKTTPPPKTKQNKTIGQIKIGPILLFYVCYINIESIYKKQTCWNIENSQVWHSILSICINSGWAKMSSLFPSAFTHTEKIIMIFTYLLEFLTSPNSLFPVSIYLFCFIPKIIVSLNTYY